MSDFGFRIFLARLRRARLPTSEIRNPKSEMGQIRNPKSEIEWVFE